MMLESGLRMQERLFGCNEVASKLICDKCLLNIIRTSTVTPVSKLTSFSLMKAEYSGRTNTGGLSLMSFSVTCTRVVVVALPPSVAMTVRKNSGVFSRS